MYSLSYVLERLDSLIEYQDWQHSEAPSLIDPRVTDARQRQEAINAMRNDAKRNKAMLEFLRLQLATIGLTYQLVMFDDNHKIPGRVQRQP